MTSEITTGGISVPLTHAGKVLFPGDGLTKEDLARYYADVADVMLPWLRDRPVTMVRYPDGLDGQRFFQKNAPSYFPDWIRRVEVGKEGGVVEHVICDKPATLVYLANQGLHRDPRVRQPRRQGGGTRSAWRGRKPPRQARQLSLGVPRAVRGSLAVNPADLRCLRSTAAGSEQSHPRR